MKSYHILKRGNRFNYVCRIPVDLLGYFPRKTIYRSLKSSDSKAARLLAASYEFEVQKVFMRLRTNMLSTFEAQILVERLTTGIRKIESTAYGKKFSQLVDDIEEMSIADLKLEFGCDEATAKEKQAQIYEAFAVHFGKLLTRLDTSMTIADVEKVDAVLRKQYKVMLSDEEKTILALKFLGIDKELAHTEADIRRGNDDRYHRLVERRDRDAAKAGLKFFLRDIMKAFLATYDEPEKSGIALNSWQAVKRHTDFISETLGNIEFQELNSKVATDKLRLALNKRKKTTGDPLSTKEIGSYVSRLRSIVTFAMDKYELDCINKIKVKRTINEDDRRLSFNPTEMQRLEEALCSAPMIFGKGEHPRHDRYWILLIAVLHGFRKSSIVNLHRRHITADEHTGLLCFDLTQDKVLLKTKTKNMRALVPIHPLLHQLGFVNWLNRRELPKDTKLFEDTPAGFGQWFNGMTPTSGWNYDHITQEDNKTLHSFRHYFCCCMDELEIAENHKNEMSGHASVSRSKGVRSTSYTERTRVKTMHDTFLKSVEPGRILMTDMNWMRLRDRAMELFGI